MGDAGGMEKIPPQSYRERAVREIEGSAVAPYRARPQIIIDSLAFQRAPPVALTGTAPFSG
jgi:hypothetical protein